MQVVSGEASILQRGVHVSGGEHVSSSNVVTFTVEGTTAAIRTSRPVVIETGDRISISGEYDKSGLFNAYAVHNHTRQVTTSCESLSYVVIGAVFIVFGIPFSIVGVGLIFVAAGIWMICHNNKMTKALKMVA